MAGRPLRRARMNAKDTHDWDSEVYSALDAELKRQDLELQREMAEEFRYVDATALNPYLSAIRKRLKEFLIQDSEIPVRLKREGEQIFSKWEKLKGTKESMWQKTNSLAYIEDVQKFFNDVNRALERNRVGRNFPIEAFHGLESTLVAATKARDNLLKGALGQRRMGLAKKFGTGRFGRRNPINSDGLDPSDSYDAENEEEAERIWANHSRDVILEDICGSAGNGLSTMNRKILARIIALIPESELGAAVTLSRTMSFSSEESRRTPSSRRVPPGWSNDDWG